MDKDIRSVRRRSLLHPTTLLLVLLSLCAGHRNALALPPETATPASFPFPQNLVLDVRLFETRTLNPNRDVLRELNFFIATDGRGVTASQWLATLAQKVPEVFLAASAFDTVRVEQEAARVRWTLRSRSLEMEFRLRNDRSADSFKAEIETTFSSADQPLRQLHEEVELQLRRTTVWSAEALEIPVRDYLSHFREYPDREHRGLLYERLRDQSISLIVCITPRVLAEDELPQLTPEKLALPPGTQLPELDNPLGVPLYGTVVVGFEIDPSGSPINPQIVLSSLPEANPRILGETAHWMFPGSPADAKRRRWGRVEVSIEIP